MVRTRLRSLLDRVARATGWNVVRKPPLLWASPDSELRLTLDIILGHYFARNGRPFCLQVGAFDGKAGDPLYPLIEKYGLEGVLVEPQSDAYEKLRANYARFGDRFRLVNAAIAPADGKRTLYRVRPGTPGPEWLPQLASFDRETVLKHSASVSGLEASLVMEEVTCVTFTTLLAAAPDRPIDLLQVDAEGYDAEILRLFDLAKRRPAIVHFEHKHLGRGDHEACLRELIALDYRIALLRENTLAYAAADACSNG